MYKTNWYNSHFSTRWLPYNPTRQVEIDRSYNIQSVALPTITSQVRRDNYWPNPARTTCNLIGPKYPDEFYSGFKPQASAQTQKYKPKLHFHAGLSQAPAIWGYPSASETHLLLYFQCRVTPNWTQIVSIFPVWDPPRLDPKCSQISRSLMKGPLNWTQMAPKICQCNRSKGPVEEQKLLQDRNQRCRNPLPREYKNKLKHHIIKPKSFTPYPLALAPIDLELSLTNNIHKDNQKGFFY